MLVELVPDRKAHLNALYQSIIGQGLSERIKPDFCPVDFARKTINDFGDEPVVVCSALETIFRSFTLGYSDPVFFAIFHALDLHIDSPKDVIAEKMLPYLAVGGRIQAQSTFLSCGFTKQEAEELAEQAENLHTQQLDVGELTFHSK